MKWGRANDLLLLDHPFYRVTLALQLALYAPALAGLRWYLLLLLSGQPFELSLRVRPGDTGRSCEVCNGQKIRKVGTDPQLRL